VYRRLAALTSEPHSAARSGFATDRHATVTKRREVTQQGSTADAEFYCQVTDGCRLAAAQHVSQLQKPLGPRHFW
jgi:hypothetical protein